MQPQRHLARSDYYSAKFPRQDLLVNVGDTIEYLQDRAEGNCFLRVGEQVVETFPYPEQNKAFRLVTRPTTAWWIRVVLADKRPIGWLLVDDKNVKVGHRSF